MTSCNKNMMCEYKLNTQGDTKKWLLENHPDKGGHVDSTIFTNVVNCYKNREYCTPLNESPIPSVPLSDDSSINTRSSVRIIDKKKRDKIYNCMRQTANWSKILPQHKMDNKKFNPEMVKTAIHNASPKLEQLFHIIQQVDENDMKTHGKYFKHFIFSDVKEEGYGAKILASAFIANGYKNLITAQTIENRKSSKLILLPTGADGKNKSFGLLSSSAIFNSEFNQKFKKEVLTKYNKRPENIQGADMRFIILDSGFKEGIDLFDVKYVHIFEPSMTVADLKQTIGRATRTCGQKGLNFEPNVGWPLFVYNYYIAIPDGIKDMYQVSDPSLLAYPDEDKFLFQKASKLKDAAILYSAYDKTLAKLSEQLYKLAPILSVDFELTKNIHRMDDMSYLYEQQNAATNSGVSSGGGLQNKDKINCNGKCGLRSTNDIPATVGFLLKVYLKYGHNRSLLPIKNVRNYLCEYMKSHPEYCEQVNSEWANRAAIVPELLDNTIKNSSYMDMDVDTNNDMNNTTTNLNIATPYMKLGNSTPTYANPSPLQREPSYMDLAEIINKRSATPYMKIGNSSAKSGATYASPLKRESSYMDFDELTNKNGSMSYLKKNTSNRTRNITSNRTRKSKRKTISSSNRRNTNSIVKIANDVMKQLELVPYLPETNNINYSIVEYNGKPDSQMKQKEIGPPPKKLNFAKMRDFIKTNYVKNFTWDEIVVENKCVDPRSKPQSPMATQSSMDTKTHMATQSSMDTKTLMVRQSPMATQSSLAGGSRIMSLNPTQDFVRTFFTPKSPYKGLLLFHSVGTGKTCSAIATATSTFEKEGYTILWVTRNTLKSDVYKNMFDDVCHIILADRMKRDGLTIPDDPSKRKRLLSKNWIDPISYKTFSNLLTPGAHNEYMDKLIERNGKTDILRKTLIIIDEAHKLYGGDLKAAERPNMEIMERLLQNSYDKSGKESAKLLIMTATPFTNSPMELFKLINLCKDHPSEKITTNLKEFKDTYMNADSILTDAGVKKMADKLSGYISYLNREQDPTQFAQPIMIEVPVIMSHISDNELRRAMFSDENNQINDMNKLELRELMKQQDTHIKELNKRLRETQGRIRSILKEGKNRCKTIKNRAEKKACNDESRAAVEAEVYDTVKNIKEEIERLKTTQLENKGLKQAEHDRITKMKDKLNTLRNELLQEVMLAERCKNIKFV